MSLCETYLNIGIGIGYQNRQNELTKTEGESYVELKKFICRKTKEEVRRMFVRNQPIAIFRCKACDCYHTTQQVKEFVDASH